MTVDTASLPVRYLPTSDGRLAYRETGSGAPLVLLHGGFTDHRMWEAQLRAFAPTHRVIAWDARGHGASDNATRPFRQADDLAALLRGLDAAPAVLVGLSMGGGIATDCALEHPELVRALVVSGAGTSEPVFEHPWVLGVIADQQASLAAGDLEGWADAFALWAAGPDRDLSEVDPEVVRLIREMGLATLRKHTPGEPDHRVPVTRTWERVPDIRVPLITINGALESPDHLAMAARLAHLVPDGRGVTVPGAAHYPNMENPDAFNAELSAFLERLP
ncbi:MULTISPECIES: alpha/beta fold hydrolase [Streptomyces]|uniref:alpha/beta fold hydrolase n=1 Tax=Streptomyces TaxID=1883 RepID=UPI00167326AE|nr:MULTISPECIES: alpha/beta fold hydrolase [Streptomyces]MBK3523147.1 alpha/beta fold hydrolase [Streptomyces sp. MBT70]GGS07963.1 hydrolase [Streptomyces eurythermus]